MIPTRISVRARKTGYSIMKSRRTARPKRRRALSRTIWPLTITVIIRVLQSRWVAVRQARTESEHNIVSEAWNADCQRPRTLADGPCHLVLQSKLAEELSLIG